MVYEPTVLEEMRRVPIDDGVDYGGALSVAVDYEGRTDQTYRWSNEDWHLVWRRETLPLLDKINAGQLAIVVFPPGQFMCDLDLFGDARHGERAWHVDMGIVVTNGSIAIGDLGKIAEDWEVAFPVAYESFFERVFTVPAGWYTVRFSFPRDVPVFEERGNRQYGSDEQPACVVRCERLESTHRDRPAAKVIPVAEVVGASNSSSRRVKRPERRE